VQAPILQVKGKDDNNQKKLVKERDEGVNEAHFDEEIASEEDNDDEAVTEKDRQAATLEIIGAKTAVVPTRTEMTMTGTLNARTSMKSNTMARRSRPTKFRKRKLWSMMDPGLKDRSGTI
jgi:hypothetical protein